jgi:DNA adenine methylase
MRNASPLRYPGGKWRLAPFVEALISTNFNQPPLYVEPYAGGASLALSLLLSGSIRHVHLNDLDPAVYCFWKSILRHTNAFIDLVAKVPVTAKEWMRQKKIYANRDQRDCIRLGFATFFLNRTNHSGIMNAGMIGGKNQTGKWKIDARFNRQELMRRIRIIAEQKDRINVTNEDALHFIRKLRNDPTTLVYLDPPYYLPGRRLYLNAYRPSDHANVRHEILRLHCNWIVSYDDVLPIRRLYKGLRSRRLNLLHTARTTRLGNEVMYFSPSLRIYRSGTLLPRA